jgi:hypothetical protein
MNIRIEQNQSGQGCTVWLGKHSVSFASLESAQAYVAQLQKRIAASPTLFEERTGQENELQSAD